MICQTFHLAFHKGAFHFLGFSLNHLNPEVVLFTSPVQGRTFHPALHTCTCEPFSPLGKSCKRKKGTGFFLSLSCPKLCDIRVQSFPDITTFYFSSSMHRWDVFSNIPSLFSANNTWHSFSPYQHIQ